MTTKLPQILTDAPNTQLMNWAGFSAKKDKTMLHANFLVEPSKNCFIPDGDKVVPREGTQTVFQGSNPILDVGIIGKYTKFKNFFGVEMDVKAYRETTEGEQVYVLFNNVYVPITWNPQTVFNGTDKIYFSTYTDSTLDLAFEKRIPRLCWVNGYEHSDGTGRVFSWTGGISAMSTVVGNVITIPAGLTFKQLGFTEYFLTGALTGEIHVTINGVDYFSNSLAELDTNTLTLDNPPVAVAGDIVTSTVEVDDLVAPMDILKQNKNYMYYGNFDLRQWYMSNQFGRPSVTRITESNAQLDDLIIDPSTDYSGIGRNVYKLIITDIHPAIDFEEQTFESPQGGANDTFFDTSGYTGTGRNVYKISIVSNTVFTRLVGSQIGVFQQGEVVVGATSGALGILYGNPFVSYADMSGADVNCYQGAFQTGEVITGQTSGATLTLFQSTIGNSFNLYKNGVLVPLVGGPGPDSFPCLGTYTAVQGMPDGLEITWPNYGSHFVGDTLTLTIEQDVGAPDEFTWQKNNGTINGPQNITTTPQLIEDGIVVSWVKDTGHAVGDYWLIEVNQEVVRPWANFYYSIDFTSQESVRRPGEGYIYSLPSNFWTMDTFEEALYVNTSNGEWGYSSPTLSANLLSEDISFTPLKQTVSSKVLYPYLTGHNRNDLLFVDENKNLTSLGRLQLIERVQMNDMSDFIRNAFRDASFIDGSIIFQDDKTWITSPEDNTMFCFDERTKYWQPPQVIPNLGLLTIIGTNLYVHAELNTATRSLNDATADGDDGVEYEVVIRSSTYDHGNRWNKKTANMAFWEGYVSEAPPMKMNVYFDVDGCSGIETADVTPVFCTDVVNNGNFGGGQDGGHEHGGDITLRTNYARYQFAKLKVHHFYFSSLEMTCRATKHPYELLSMGINLAQSKYNNKEYRSPESALENLLPI